MKIWAHTDSSSLNSSSRYITQYFTSNFRRQCDTVVKSNCSNEAGWSPFPRRSLRLRPNGPERMTTQVDYGALSVWTLLIQRKSFHAAVVLHCKLSLFSIYEQPLCRNKPSYYWSMCWDKYGRKIRTLILLISPSELLFLIIGTSALYAVSSRRHFALSYCTITSNVSYFLATNQYLYSPFYLKF